MFDLAYRWGCGLDEALVRIGGSQCVAEWMAYSLVRGPLGPQRDDLLNAKLCRELWSIAVPSMASKIPLAEFLLFEEHERQPQPQSEETQMAIARGICAALGGSS